jgi:hypothetical protein
MATRQRTRTPRKTASNQTTSAEQLPEDSTQRRVEESQVLRAAFDTTAVDEEPRAGADGADAPKATFVGEQLIYKERYERIAEAAYHRAERRGFAPGNELDDWLAAEREVDALLSSDRARNA